MARCYLSIANSSCYRTREFFRCYFSNWFDCCILLNHITTTSVTKGWIFMLFHLYCPQNVNCLPLVWNVLKIWRLLLVHVEWLLQISREWWKLIWLFHYKPVFVFLEKFLIFCVISMFMANLHMLLYKILVMWLVLTQKISLTHLSIMVFSFFFWYSWK